MYQGTLSLEDFGRELARRRSAAKDYIVPTGHMHLMAASNHVEIALPDGDKRFAATDNFHRQLGGKLAIPRKLYGRLKGDHPDLLDGLVNPLLERESHTRLVRTLDDKARAFLSDRYRTIGNWEVAEAAIPVLAEQSGMQIESHEVTDDHMYIKATFPTIRHEVKPGDWLAFGMSIENSETGHNALKVCGWVKRLMCANGMMLDTAFRRAHLGRRQGSDDDGASEWLRDETREADDKLLTMKMADCIRGAISEGFSRTIAKIDESATDMIEKPEKAVEEVANRYGLLETESSSVMKYFVSGGDVSRWGLANAVTRASQDSQAGYDRATELERVGGSIMEMPSAAWARTASNN